MTRQEINFQIYQQTEKGALAHHPYMFSSTVPKRLYGHKPLSRLASAEDWTLTDPQWDGNV